MEVEAMSSPEPPAEAPVEGASKPNEPTPVLPTGIEAGLVAGFVVAAVYLIRDLAIGIPLHTPSVLGTFFIEGADAARSVRSAPGAAMAFHAAHFALWVIAGGAAGWMMNRVEESPRLWFLPWVGVALLMAVIVALDGFTSAIGLPRLHLWLGAIAGVLAMVGFFQWRHPHAMSLVRGLGPS